MEGIIGRKAGMTQIFGKEGEFIPVTVVEAGPCPVAQIKTVEKEGYNALQLAFGQKRKTLFNKPATGHFEKCKIEPRRFLREFRLVKLDKRLEPGKEIKVDLFTVGEKVDVTGISKGLGFQGVVRRHKFRGGPKTHGQSDRVRAPGSVGASSYPSRTYKGQRMGGRMGGARVTVSNLEVVGVDLEKNILLIRGAVPGKKNAILLIKRSKRR
ncbi:MAG TPA: 50S ribosomal protein L3 [Terriglobales bacterium]|nr:50S ribosomal protein L3 [Terriglobales bacterium]